MRVPGLGKCAAPNCDAQFKRLGTGIIYSLPVEQPELWGLPGHVKQKVVWLCADCARTKAVEFDGQHCQVLIVSTKSIGEWHNRQPRVTVL